MAFSNFNVDELDKEKQLQFYRDLVDASQDMIWQCDADGRYTYLNPAWEETFGYPIEEMLGKKFTVFQTPEQAQKDMKVFNGLIQGNMVKGLETVHLGKGNREIHLIFNAVFIRDKNGIICGVRGTAHDITTRKNAAKALLESEGRLRTIIDSAPFGAYIYEVDQNEDLIFSGYNKSADSIIGISHEQFMGKKITDAFPPLAETEIPVSYLNVAKTGESYETEQIAYEHNEIKGAFKVHAVQTAPNRVAAFFIDITESKKAETALRKSEERFRHIAENSSDMIYRMSLPDGIYEYVSPSSIEMFGYTPKEFITSPLLIKNTIHPDWRDYFNEQWQILLDGNMPPTYEYQIVHAKTKETRWLYQRNILILNDEGQPVAIEGIVTDITERKQAEKIIIDKTRFLENISSQVPGMLYQFKMAADGTFSVPYSSKGVQDIFGCTPEAVLDNFDPIFNAIYPDDRNLILRTIDESVKTLSQWKCEYRVQISEQPIKWIYGNSIPEKQADGSILWCGYNTDITERKKTERTISEERERLLVTLHSIGDGVITTDTNGAIVLINRVAEKLTGWKQIEAEGKPLDQIFTIINENTRYPIENPVEKVLSSGQIIELASHTLLISRNGTERIIADSGAPIKDNDSKTIGVVLVFRDMTEKNKLLSNIQRIDKLDSIGILAGGIAHDFNNLLGGIFGYIDLARERCDTDKTASSYLDKALLVYERAKNLTLQLLTFSKGGEPKLKTGHLGKLVKDNATFVLSGTKVNCSFAIAPDLFLCDFDENQIGQVIDNLIINAQQAMPMGGTISITINNISFTGSNHPTLENGDYIRISISDTGVGIQQDLLKHIFDPFFTTKQQGNGLGLATSYSIIQKHDGSIEVESIPGKGTTFHIFLPASKKEKINQFSHSVVRHKGHGTILVMDDEDFMREIVGRMLATMGYTIIEAKDGNEAIQLCEETLRQGKTIRAAFFDLTIPGGMGGKETILKFREHYSSIPVFASSGYSQDPAMARPAEFGFTDSIRKPFKKVELAELMNKHLKS